MIFVDTSAILAVLDAADERHAAADRAWNELLDKDEPLVMSSYVLVELLALAQSRLGIAAVRTLDAEVLPLIGVVWVDAEIHRRALSSVLAASHRNLSLVDCTSFEVMRRIGIRTAFTLDSDFSEQGFKVMP